MFQIINQNTVTLAHTIDVKSKKLEERWPPDDEW